MLRLPCLVRPVRARIGPYAHLYHHTKRESSQQSRSYLQSKLGVATTPSSLVRAGAVHQVRAAGHAPLVVHLAPFSSNFPGGRGGRGSGRVAAGFGALGTGALLLFGKTKYILGALQLTKLASLGSMVLTIGTYSMFFGLPYAAGMVGLITIHEAGHALVMRQRGIPFSPMVFIPFVGAAVAMNRYPRDAWEDAMIAFGGPVLGSIGAAGVAVVGHTIDSQFCYALADFGFMINLFNLLPIGSMDGGRIAGALSPYAGLAGLGLGGWMVWNGFVSNPIMYLILLSGGWEAYQRYANPHMLPPNYYKITPVQRTMIAGGYFGLIGALLVCTDLNNRRRKLPEVLEREKHWDMRY